MCKARRPIQPKAREHLKQEKRQMPALNLSQASRADLTAIAVDATKKNESFARRFAKMKEDSAGVGEAVMDGLVTVGAGALSGGIASKYPGQWMKVDPEVWLIAGSLILGLTGLGGPRMRSAAFSFANGTGAVLAYKKLST